MGSNFVNLVLNDSHASYKLINEKKKIGPHAYFFVIGCHPLHPCFDILEKIYILNFLL